MSLIKRISPPDLMPQTNQTWPIEPMPQMHRILLKLAKSPSVAQGPVTQMDSDSAKAEWGGKILGISMTILMLKRNQTYTKAWSLTTTTKSSLRKKNSKNKIPKNKNWNKMDYRMWSSTKNQVYLTISTNFQPLNRNLHQVRTPLNQRHTLSTKRLFKAPTVITKKWGRTLILKKLLWTQKGTKKSWSDTSN